MPPVHEHRPSGSTRRDPVWLLVLAGALLVARVAMGMYEAKHPATRPDLLSWVNAESAERVSRHLEKPILYDFSAEWCGPCHMMEREVFAEKRYADTIDRLVVPVQVVDRQREDGSNTAIVDSLQRALGVNAFPTLAVVSKGKIVDRLEGYAGAEETARWIAATAMKARLADSTTTGIRLHFP